MRIKPNINGMMKIIKKSVRNLYFSSIICLHDGTTSTNIKTNSKLIAVSISINNKEFVRNTIGNNNGNDKFVSRLTIFNF